MKFLRVQCKGSVNSFRQPDFFTYHKTLPLPPKTTIGGMLGSALGISPNDVNEEWLKKERFKVGIVGKNNGKANDLWQIRKYEDKQIKSYNKGEEDAPYKTAVIVRELLIGCDFIIYFYFENNEDYELIANALQNPKWAISLGREDELIKINHIDIVDVKESEDAVFINTVMPGNINESKYNIQFERIKNNLMSQAPTIVKLPTKFDYDNETDVRVSIAFGEFSFIHDLPISVNQIAYVDEELKHAFQIF